MVDRFSEQMPTNSFWKTKGLNHCSPFTSVTRMTHVFLEVSVLYKAVLLPVVLPRLDRVDRPLGVGDDAAHVVRLVVRAGVVRPSRVRLQEQLDSIRGLCVRRTVSVTPLPTIDHCAKHSPISFCSTASTAFSGHRGGVHQGSSDSPRGCRGSCDSHRQSSATVSLCPHRLARRSGIHSGSVPGIIQIQYLSYSHFDARMPI